MTLQINLEPSVQEILAAKARARGVPLETLIEETLKQEANATEPRPMDQGRLQALREQERSFQQEMEWLAKHRKEYAGKWIALDGPNLIAVADSGKEVYAKVSGRSTPPLVLLVEKDDLPFGGW